MARVNLYNYRAQENYYKKLRIYLLLVVGVVIALLVNVMIYGYLQIKIMYQQTRNSFLITHINILDNQLKPMSNHNSNSSNQLRLNSEMYKTKDYINNMEIQLKLQSNVGLMMIQQNIKYIIRSIYTLIV